MHNVPLHCACTSCKAYARLLNSHLVLMQVLRDRYENVRYIVDGAMPRLSLSALQSFVAHYPDSSQYKSYMKLDTAAAAPLYMPSGTRKSSTLSGRGCTQQ